MIRIKRLTQNVMPASASDSKETNLSQLIMKMRDMINIINKIVDSEEVPDNIDDKLYIGDLVYTCSQFLKMSYTLLNYLAEVSDKYQGDKLFAPYAKDLDTRYTAIQSKIDSFLTAMSQQKD